MVPKISQVGAYEECIFFLISKLNYIQHILVHVAGSSGANRVRNKVGTGKREANPQAEHSGIKKKTAEKHEKPKVWDKYAYKYYASYWWHWVPYLLMSQISLMGTEWNL